MHGVTEGEAAKEKFLPAVSSDSQLLPVLAGVFPYLFEKARLRPFVPLSCKESQPLPFEETDCGIALPAVRDVATSERFTGYTNKSRKQSRNYV